MRILLVIFTTFLICIGCNTSNNKSSSDKEQQQIKDITIKVININDSIIADTIWKMIFSLESIDQLTIQKYDSTVSFQVSNDQINVTALKKEIISRGGKLE